MPRWGVRVWRLFGGKVRRIREEGRAVTETLGIGADGQDDLNGKTDAKDLQIGGVVEGSAASDTGRSWRWS
eukprot:scaffold1430_cov257-Pinguiococcus_pyrenoidosus.AAC.18